MTIGEITIACLSTPGHMEEHVSYVVTHVTPTSSKIPFLFCGDTLFIGGCGRVFTGNYAQMYQSLNKLINLPQETLVFCAHEYTLSNLKFAKFIDSDNDFINHKHSEVSSLLAQGLFSVGSPIHLERAYNPFFTCQEPRFDAVLRSSDPVERFKKVRMLKDTYK